MPLSAAGWVNHPPAVWTGSPLSCTIAGVLSFAALAPSNELRFASASSGLDTVEPPPAGGGRGAKDRSISAVPRQARAGAQVRAENDRRCHQHQDRDDRARDRPA